MRSHRGIMWFCLSLGLTLSACQRPSPPATIAFFTDFGSSDVYGGVVSGVILRIAPQTRLLTITHDAPDYDLRAGSYLLALAAKEFPVGTIFLAVVDPGVGTARRPIVLETLDHKFFVAPDNGLLTGVMDSLGIRAVRVITNDAWTRAGLRSATFHGRDIFGPVAAHLAAGDNVAEVGPVVSDPVRLAIARPAFHNEQVSGEILFCDHYGNLITNIPTDLVQKAGLTAGTRLVLKISASGSKMKRSLDLLFGRTYADVPSGEYVALINSHGLLEIAKNLGAAAAELEVAAGAAVTLALAPGN